MITQNLLSHSGFVQAGYGRSPASIEAQQVAEKMFEHLHRQAWRGQFWAMIQRRSQRLWHLHPEEPIRPAGARRRAQVSLARIKGSTEGRGQDFDADFRPLRTHTMERWVQIAAALRKGATLPPVELARIDEVCFVVDGHHRLSVVSALGRDEIEANVTQWEKIPPG